MNLLSIFLQLASGKEGSGPQFWIMIVLMIVVFYFFMIRPQQKKQKEIRKFQESIQSGTEVVTSGGIYGKVKDIKDRYFIVEIAENVRVKIEKTAVFASAADNNASPGIAKK